MLVMLTPAGERLTQRIGREAGDRNRGCCCCAAGTRASTSASGWCCSPREISVGDFVCNGGEVPAMVVIDTVIRLVPGVLGDEESAAEESHSEPGRLEYPQYTRPRVFRGLEVPEILLSGNHAGDREVAARTVRAAEPRARTSEPASAATTGTTRATDRKEGGPCRRPSSSWSRQRNLKTDVPDFRVGDPVDVHQQILEGAKERIQVFEGDVIARSGGGVREMFTVRRIVQGEGVERIFPIHSPQIAKIEVKQAGKVRRAKLYYLRDRVGKATKIRDDVKRQTQIDADLKAAAEAAAKAAQEAAAKATAEGGESKSAKKKKATQGSRGRQEEVTAMCSPRPATPAESPADEPAASRAGRGGGGGSAGAASGPRRGSSARSATASSPRTSPTATASSTCSPSTAKRSCSSRCARPQRTAGRAERHRRLGGPPQAAEAHRGDARASSPARRLLGKIAVRFDVLVLALAANTPANPSSGTSLMPSRPPAASSCSVDR